MIQIFLQCYFLIITIAFCQNYKDLSYQQSGQCHNEDINCVSFKNSSIVKLLQSISNNKKVKDINMLLSNYATKQMYVQQTPEMGFGLVVTEPVQKYEFLFKYDMRKIIGCYSINTDTFFQNSLNRQHNKFKVSEKFRSIKDQRMQALKCSQNLIIHIFYHFSQIDKSFLKADLQGLPYDEIAPIYSFTYYELELLKYQPQIYNKITSKIRSIREEYQDFLQNMNTMLSPEQFSLFFQLDSNISFDDYIFLKFICSSRAHEYNQRKYLNYFIQLPILHYSNQQNDIYLSTSSFLLQTRMNKMFFANLQDDFIVNTEYFYYYGYQNLMIYAFFSGFVPKTFEPHCQQFEILNNTMAQQYGVPAFSCLDDENIKLYDIIGKMIQWNQYQQQECNLRLSKNNFKHIYERFDDIFVNCYHLLKDFNSKDIFKSSQQLIDFLEQNYKLQKNMLLIYVQQKKNINQSSKNIQLMIDMMNIMEKDVLQVKLKLQLHLK